jgi:hypothetical protein
MKLHFSWKLGVGLCLFILAMLYNEQIRQTIEGFDAVSDIIKNMKQARDGSISLGSYTWWVAWLYAHPETSSEPLNDFKSRVFQPNCEFRKDWATKLPPGLIIPVVQGSVEFANIGYKAYLDALADKNPYTLNTLDDAKKRFMDPSCQFLNPSDPSTYNQNYRPLFK